MQGVKVRRDRSLESILRVLTARKGGSAAPPFFAYNGGPARRRKPPIHPAHRKERNRIDGGSVSRSPVNQSIPSIEQLTSGGKWSLLKPESDYIRIGSQFPGQEFNRLLGDRRMKNGSMLP